ncbi:CRISPR-associated helicase Cas3' [Pirellulimonas nuda]
MHFAHTLPDRAPEDWEPLERHLQLVSDLAAQFAGELIPRAPDVSAWGGALGRWHDLGKYSAAFQARIRGADSAEAHIEGLPGRVDHSTAGAKHAMESAPRWGRLLAYALAGHHAGLADTEKLSERLNKTIEPWRHAAPSEWLATGEIGRPPLSIDRNDAARFAFQCALFTRMLFSCLVDADRLQTEAFCNPERAAERVAKPPMGDLSTALNDYLKRLRDKATPSPVNDQRAAVHGACRAAVSQLPGLFSLTVPTGGGKTLASLAFALEHAQQHGLRRVVMAIPFTSIIEQTAEVYRKVFAELGDGVVLEHHSNLDPEKETRLNRLAAENWDAPLVVTTNVQLFESLFACRTTPCQKLHRLAGSVIILDEAQTLPVGLLRPCLAALRELAADYGCSIVLCTATQPALEHRDDFKIGLEGVREIIPEPELLYSAMRRVEADNLGAIDNDALVERLSAEPSWLTIVNTRAHAAELYRRLRAMPDAPPDDLFHLSTLMCGQHRSDHLVKIRQRLKSGLTCRVVSTQLIEAGVDVDFPVVFRAMAGLDSIAQAAGRCNREGRLPGLGKLWLFDPTDVKPHGYLGATAATARELLPDFPDPLDPDAVRKYFELHYWKRSGDNRWDDNRVMECFPEERGEFAYDFRTAAERFQFIEDASQTLFVSYGDGIQLIEQLRQSGPQRWLLRKLQRYTVGVFQWAYNALLAARDIEILDSGFSVLANSDSYGHNLGLRLDAPGYREPKNMVL